MYHYEPPSPEEKTTYQLQEAGKRFMLLPSLNDLARQLRIAVPVLKQIAERPQYKQFFIAKQNGQKRLIETPVYKLKQLQRQLAFSLQCAYHIVRPKCAYGFILAAADDTQTRNIYSNAQQHLQSKWVLSIDLQHFFHTIPTERIYMLFRRTPFDFTKNMARCLSKLCTYQNRLPMGAPTSPVLSNWVCLALDHELQALADKNNLTYTRFADDMTFSSNRKIKTKLINEIRNIVSDQKFQLNEHKTKLVRTIDEPEITGLIIKRGKPDISEQYIKDIHKDIALLHELTSMRIVERSIFPSQLIYRFRQSVMGQINFVRFVRGGHHKSYWKLMRKLNPKIR
ncbi:MAG: RNA-directed DNA polymerase [Aureispira sp.]|nr:RNA-directed DNA polymerase [Aureispira sp.]